MQDRSSNSISPVAISEPQTESLESSLHSSSVKSSIFPRSAWNSQVAHLRVLFRVKRALDKIETIEC